MTNAQLADLLEEAARRLREKKALPAETRLAVSAEEAARLLDMSKRSFERLGLPSVTLGQRTVRYRISTIQDYLNTYDPEARRHGIE